MADKECQCPCFCDPTVARQFEQTSGRYNDRSAWASNLQQDSVVQMQSMFQAQAQNALEQTPSSTMMEQQSLMNALATLIQAAKAT